MTVIALPERRQATPALLNHYTAIDDDHLLGVIYLLHFVDPATGRHVRFGHACHYLGWTHDLPARMAKHGTYDGAKLMRYVRDAGIEWQVSRVLDRHPQARAAAQDPGPDPVLPAVQHPAAPVPHPDGRPGPDGGPGAVRGQDEPVPSGGLILSAAGGCIKPAPPSRA